MRIPLWVVLSGLILVPAVRAADDPVTIREVYWQVVPASWAYVDNAGRPWFPKLNGDAAPSIDRDIGLLAADQALLLGDRSGRVWVNPRYRTEPSTKFFDGKIWHDTGIRGRTAFEDSAGRVFIADATSVHVFDGTAWSKQPVYPQESFGDGHFVEDSAGRVWFWATTFHGGTSGEHPGTRGLWCHDRGKWTNYNQDSGLTVESVETLFPLSEDRLLVLGDLDPKSGHRPCLIWSPSHQLAEGRQNFLGLTPSGRIDHVGVDLDGLDHFIFQRNEGSSSITRVVVTPRGEARVLSEAEAERAARMPVGLFENRGRVFGRLSEIPPAVPCQPSEAICRDHLGRIYFRHTNSNSVGVVWPKFEQPGDVIRLKPNVLGVGWPFQTHDRRIWAPHHRYGAFARDGATALVYWDGGSWVDTPVKVLPHPPWSAHPSPPWQVTQPLFLSSGNTLLAVQVRDIYQDIHAAKRVEEDNWIDLLRAGEEEARKRHETKWLEASLYHNGKWSEPERMPSFLGQRWALLAEEFQHPARIGGWFAMLGDGPDRLWLAYDSTLRAADKDNIKEWKIPMDSRTPVNYSLSRLPDGKIVLTALGEKGTSLWTVSIRGGAIVAEKFAAPEGGGPPFQSKPPTIKVARDKTVWLTSGAGIWQLRDGGWERRADLADFLLEDTDGALWFRPGEGYQFGANRGFRVVNGSETKTFSWPLDYEFGELTLVEGGRILTACGYWLVELGPANDAIKREIARTIIADRYVSGTAVFRSSDGTYLVNGMNGK